MGEHPNAFQGLINQTTSLEVPLAYEVLVLLLLGSLLESWETLVVALLLLGSLSESWETLVVTLDNVGLEEKYLSLETMKSSLLNEETCWKDRISITDPKALVTKGDMNQGRGQNRSP